MIQHLILIIFCLFLTGCKVGPNYIPPEVILPLEYNENQPDKTIEIDDEDLIQWWCIFNDPFLDELLNLAIDQNFDYRIALEKVYQARSQYWVQFTQMLPEFAGDIVATRSRRSQSFINNNLTNISPVVPPIVPPTPTPTVASINPVQSFYQIGLDAIWELDLFGKFRRGADASYNIWEATSDDMRGVKITVISEVINTYSIINSYQKKIDIALQVLSLDEELLSLIQSKFDAGLSDQREIETALGTLEVDKAQLTVLQSALKQSIYSLAVLLGVLPEDIILCFQIERPIPYSEGRVPISLPSELLRRRPDIRSAERRLAASSEQIGIAIAELFPSVSLTGSSTSFASNPLQGSNIGFTSDRLHKLFRPESFIWGIGGILTVPVFDFGKRNAAVDVQISLRNQAYYTYQKTVIAAIQETEQALVVYFNEEKRLRYLENEVQANERNLSLTKDLFQAGLVNYTQLLQVKNTWLLSLNTLTDSQVALTTDLIAIYKALGGDW